MPGTSFVLNSKIIQAGAGAGKTTTLIRTFVDNVKEFKKHHGRFPRVVISTFTRKATQELKERLYEQALKENDQELFDYLNKKSWVHISTLHGLLAPFLSRYGAKAGFNPEIKIVSSSDSEKKLKRLVKKAFEKNSNLIDILDYLNWSDICSGLLKVYETSILFDDFSWDSVESLQIESEKTFKELSLQHQILSSKLLQLAEHASWKTYSGPFSQKFKDYESLVNWRESLGSKPRYSEAKPSLDPLLHEEVKEFLIKADGVIDQPLLNPERWESFGRLQNLFKELSNEVLPAFVKSKMDSGSISMGDLETLTVKVLKELPESGQAFAREWDYWMVDEYQDTSPVQVFILSHFIQKQPHFVVGDPQQSIYLFRGARTEVFLNKIEEVKVLGGHFDRLEKNYRSRHQLVHFFNFLFPKISSSFFTADFGSKYNEPDSPAAHLTLLPPDEEDQKYSHEVQTVLSQVQELIKNGAKAEDIAILSRKNSTLEQFVNCAKDFKIPVQCPSITNYWKRREILDLISLTHFLLNSYNQHSLLVLLRSPWFYVSDEKLHSLVTDTSRAENLWQKICDLAVKDTEIQKPAALLKSLKETAYDFGVSSALMKFLKESDFLNADRYIDPTGRREANIWKYISDLKMQERKPGQNLIEFIDAILEAENLNVDAAEQDAAPLVEPNRVTLLTIHASKGLQFKHVFVVGLGSDSQSSRNQIFTFDEEKKVFSISFRDDDGSLLASPVAQAATQKLKEREAEEGWRVFYVALTRAQETLWLSATAESRKNSWIKNLPLQLEDGDHSIGESFYRVKNQALIPKLNSHLAKEEFKSMEPLMGFFKETAPTKKVSVTNSLTTKPDSLVQHNVLGKAKALEKAQYGTMAHKVFESLAVRKGQSFQTEAGLQTALDYIQKLAKPPMKEILKNGHAEWGFSVKIGEGVLQGSIDLWAELEDAVYIIDYKTGSSAYSESAFEQMSIYADALKRMGACSKSKPQILVAIYPFEGKVLLKQ